MFERTTITAPSGTRRASLLATALAVALTACSHSAVAGRSESRAAVGGPDWTLNTVDPGNGAPTFLGNGYFGERIPAAGMGDMIGPVPTNSQLAGFYAQVPGQAQQRADLPTWSTLAFSDGTGTYGRLPAGTVPCASCAAVVASTATTLSWQGSVSNYGQTLDLYHAALTTHATWTSPGGHVTDLNYQVLVDRARPHVAAVRLVFTPRWAGSATVTDLLDGSRTSLLAHADRTSAVARPQQAGADATTGVISERVTANGTAIHAGLSSVLQAPAGATVGPAVSTAPGTTGQQARMQVAAGKTYTVTKYIGITSSQEDPDPLLASAAQADAAATSGYGRLRAEHESAWAALWRTDIVVDGDAVLQSDVRAALFYTLESARAGTNWSLSPAGLSSPGYNGHVFWDAETWMYPALLATHPDIALAVDTYRSLRLRAARGFAAQTGFAGARFPWESALSGDDQTPAFADTPAARAISLDTGQDEQHITADVTLAQWQYYLATGDRRWLAASGWPVLEGAAQFWASRAVPDPKGGYDLLQVMGPDEHRDGVNNSAYTNVSAAMTLRIATAAAGVVGHAAPPGWLAIADGLLRTVPFDSKLGIHLEDDTYTGQTIKQADVTMLQYPWELPMTTAAARNDVNYYLARTDRAGPSMTDAINAIDTAALGDPGCDDYYFLVRSVAPFVRDPYAQFSETRSGGAFTFLTGAGGFLQEFLYGFSGLRWNQDALVVNPTLPPQMNSVTLRDLSWQGRVFTLRIGAQTTTLNALSGPRLPVRVAGRSLTLEPGKSVSFPTRRPDLATSTDLARCRPVTATSADPSQPAVGAVDGNAATAWQATTPRAELEVDLGAARSFGRVSVDWGPARAIIYALSVSSDGHNWRPLPVGQIDPTRRRDDLTFPSVSARYVKMSITSTNTGTGAAVNEFAVSA